MKKNEWQQIGEDIKKQVQHAIDTNDFTELSKNIGETVSFAASDVGKTLTDVGKGINDIGKSLNDAVSDAAGNFQKEMKQAVTGKSYVHDHNAQNRRQVREVYYGKPNLRPDPKLFDGAPKGSVSGIAWMLLGFGSMGIAGVFTVQSVLGILMGEAAITALALPMTGAATGGALGIYGTGIKNRVDRYRRYVELVKDKLYCSIEELAEKTGRSKRFVRRDLKRMMRQGMFRQAHLDKQESCFIASDAMYEQYMLTQKQYEQAQLEDKEHDRKKTEMKNDTETDSSKVTTDGTLDSRAAEILEDGREYIRVIRKCNDEIPGEEMSEKLDKLELLVTRIFARVEENPELAPDLQKMLSYYLPTTRKLLEAYRDLDKHDVEVKNISDTKREIEMTVDTINKAFEAFLDELFRDRAWDIQSDISVLNTMLKQDGYLKSDFDKGEKES